jgi:hypothetical protein
MLKEIRDIYSREKKKKDGRPLGALWDWAMEPKSPKQRSERFEVLSAWARKKERAASDKDTREAFDLNAEQYRKKYRFFKEKADKPAPAKGVRTFDGKPVAAWWAPILSDVRRTGTWRGSLTSGFRSPEFSEQLCRQICGAPTCPGRCAGRTSNHTKLDAAAAVDVSDPAGFRAGLVEIGKGELHNALGAADPWHFSRSGR